MGRWFESIPGHLVLVGVEMSREVDWSSVVVEGNIDDGFYATEGCWDDGLDMSEEELDELDPSKLYDIGYDKLIMAAEAAFEGDR